MSRKFGGVAEVIGWLRWFLQHSELLYTFLLVCATLTLWLTAPVLVLDNPSAQNRLPMA